MKLPTLAVALFFALATPLAHAQGAVVAVLAVAEGHPLAVAQLEPAPRRAAPRAGLRQVRVMR